MTYFGDDPSDNSNDMGLETDVTAQEQINEAIQDAEDNQSQNQSSSSDDAFNMVTPTFNERNRIISEHLTNLANNTNWTGKNKSTGVNVGGVNFTPSDASIIGAGLNAIQKANYLNQAEILSKGGKAVYDETGYDPDNPIKGYVGVVSEKGLYSGNPDYDPVARNVAITDAGVYNMDRATTPNESDPQNRAQAAMAENVTNSTKGTASVSVASRRGMLAAGGGGATRRRLI